MHAACSIEQRRRVLGMQIFIYVIIGLCLLNLVYLPLDKLMQLQAVSNSVSDTTVCLNIHSSGY